MPRRQIQRSGEAVRSPTCVATVAEPVASGIAANDAAALPKHATFVAGFENARVRSPTAASQRAAAPIPARQAGADSREPSSAVTSPVVADFEATEAPKAPKPTPLDGDLVRRRWRSLIGRHPPKTMSHVLMDRILAWREQVVEVGDISPRSRAILAAALVGTAAGAWKDRQIRHGENNRDHDPNRHRLHAPIRVGTALFREHAGVLHRVSVVAEGFEWQGRTYASLSAAARAITGVRWNGRRFFALDRGGRQAVVRKTSEQDADARRASSELNEPSRTGGRP